MLTEEVISDTDIIPPNLLALILQYHKSPHGTFFMLNMTLFSVEMAALEKFCNAMLCHQLIH